MQSGPHVVEVQIAGSLSDPLRSETEQQAEGVPIGGHGVDADPFLVDEPLGEEPFQGGSDGAHDRAPRVGFDGLPPGVKCDVGVDGAGPRTRRTLSRAGRPWM